MGHSQQVGDAGSYDDVNASGYAAARNFEADWIVGAVMQAQQDAQASEEAYRMVRLQAVVALKDKGLSVRAIADLLGRGGASRSQVGRHLREHPLRFAQHQAVDDLVERIWQEDSQVARAYMIRGVIEATTVNRTGAPGAR